MPENQDNYKLLLEWLVKGFVKLAPILIGFLGMSAFDSLRKGETKEPLSTRVVNLILRFGVALTVSAGVYQILPLWPKLEPFTGVIIGFCSAFSLTLRPLRYFSYSLSFNAVMSDAMIMSVS